MRGLTAFRSRFFWKLYASYALLVLATTALTGTLLYRQMERSLIGEAEASLREAALLISPYALRSVAGAPPGDVEEVVTRLGSGTGIRITMMAPDGRVIADSHRDPATMDNHRDRPEVLGSLSSPFGVARRYSHTLEQPMLYVARTLRDRGAILGTVRAAMPLTAIEARLAAARATLALAAGIGALFALGVGMLVARRITAPIADMTEVAGALREGNYEARVLRLPRDEIGLLGETLNRLGSEVTGRMATILHDRAELQAMVAGMVEGVVAVDQDDRVLFCNRAACDLLGIDGSSSRGRKLWEVVRLARMDELLAEARARRAPARREFVIHRGGAERFLEGHANAFEAPGAGGLVLVLHDVSNLRRLERVRRDFVANVSHEIKTPLTTIKGYVETLLDGALHDEENNVRFLEKIDAQVNRLTALVGDLLSLARIEAREETLALRPVDWRPIVEGALRRHEVAIDRKRLTCAVDAGPEPVVVLGDPEAMTRVADNLLDNAISYTPSPGIIRLRLRRDGGEGRLEVEDTGIGIPDRDRDRIFERFYRVDKARSREAGGTGLGLSIVKHLVQAMRGKVEVESELGRGSRFTVRLPLAFD